MNAPHSFTPLAVGQLAALSSALGPVVDCAGSSRFLRQMFDCVRQFVDCDSLHLMRARVLPHADRTRRMEWIGSYGGDPEQIQRTMETYFGSFAERDPLNDRISDVEQIELIHLSSQAIEDAEIRSLIYDVANIHDECLVVRRSNGSAYSLSVCRARRLPAFSLHELSVLKHLGQMLLPLAELHTRMVGVPLDDNVNKVAPADVLQAYLTRRAILLSSREASVCSAFVKGMTTLSIAHAMGVKESTVETYAKRAFAKLGVSSRRALLSAVHGCEAATATVV
ncbi:LuxR C-terminal-related transcriptional regulator [Paraburkholderia bryophila]|uniref:helix-turn-helix transcriptional regulator n=1 Tax=Burkholderiaceae TaxID=119060 RepID=UPI00068FE261|nr:LuxR family transcriptional regulator [Burkholderia sp. 9120]